MKQFRRISAAVMSTFIMMIAFNTACAKHPFFKPPGDSVGSCEGTMQLLSGEKVRFTFDLYREHDREFSAYFSIPRMTRYRPVENLSFDDGIMRVEVSSPRRMYEGTIVGDSLKFKGKWQQYSGMFTIELDD